MLFTAFSEGMASWGAQGDVAMVNAADRAGYEHIVVLFATALAATIVGHLRYARWTTGTQAVAAAALLLMMLAGSGTVPVPGPPHGTTTYVPCTSVCSGAANTPDDVP